MTTEPKEGRHYYYRADKQSGRVIKTYFGTDQIGQQAAEIDAEESFGREFRQAERHVAKAIESEIERADRIARLMVEAAMYAAGYHQHSRGKWRRCGGHATS